tara:strand:- start:95 stop:337 length:243 start_codon:yes stop_codon:yes gene_type:complete
MKTITQIKEHFSDEEIKLLIEIVKGKQEFDVLGEQIKDFYSDEYNPDDMTLTLFEEDEDVSLQNDLLEKLEFDLEMWGLV